MLSESSLGARPLGTDAQHPFLTSPQPSGYPRVTMGVSMGPWGSPPASTPWSTKTPGSTQLWLPLGGGLSAPPRPSHLDGAGLEISQGRNLGDLNKLVPDSHVRPRHVASKACPLCPPLPAYPSSTTVSVMGGAAGLASQEVAVDLALWLLPRSWSTALPCGWVAILGPHGYVCRQAG